MNTATKSIGTLVAEILAKRDESDRLAAAKKQLDAECAALEAELSEMMNEQGIQSLKASDGRVVYKSRDLFVNVPLANRAAVVEACRLLGMGDLISIEVPTARLKSRIREWMGELGDQEAIPEQLRPLLHVHEEYSIRVRKS